MSKHAHVERSLEDTCPVCHKGAKIHIYACGGVGIFHNSLCPGIKELEKKYPSTCQQNGNFGTHKSAWFWNHIQRAIKEAHQENQ